MVSNPDGPDRHVPVPPEVPSVFYNQLPFLLFPKSVDDALALKLDMDAYQKLDLWQYGDERELIVKNVKCRAFYKKRLSLAHGRLGAHLNEHERYALISAVRLIYNLFPLGELMKTPALYAIISELILYTAEGNFVGRADPLFVPLQYINSYSFELEL
jgi:hypothetical protein